MSGVDFLKALREQLFGTGRGADEPAARASEADRRPPSRTFEILLRRDEMNPDPQLWSAFERWGPLGWTKQTEYFLEGREDDAYDIMSVMGPGNAAAFLAHPRIRTLTDAVTFLTKNGLDTLIDDSNGKRPSWEPSWEDLVHDAIKRRIRVAAFLSFALRFEVPSYQLTVAGTTVGRPKRGERERYMDAATLWAKQLADDAEWVEGNLETRVAYAAAVLNDEVSLAVLEAVGAFTPSKLEDPDLLLSMMRQHLDTRWNASLSHYDVEPSRRAFMAFPGMTAEQRQEAMLHFGDLKRFVVLAGEDDDPERLSSALHLLAEGGMLVKDALKLHYGGFSFDEVLAAARRKVGAQPPGEGEVLFPRLQVRKKAGQRLDAARREQDNDVFMPAGSKAPLGGTPDWSKVDRELIAIRDGRRWRTDEDEGRPYPSTMPEEETDDHEDLYGPDLWDALDKRASGGMTDLDAYGVLALTSLDNALLIISLPDVRSLGDAERFIEERGLWRLVEDHTEIMSAAANRGVLSGAFVEFMQGHEKPTGCSAELYAEGAAVWASQKKGTDYGYFETPEAFDYGQAIIDGRILPADLETLGGWSRVESLKDRDTVIKYLRKRARGKTALSLGDLAFVIELPIWTGGSTDGWMRRIIKTLMHLRAAGADVDTDALAVCLGRFGVGVLDLVDDFGPEFVRDMPGEATTREILSLTADQETSQQCDAVNHFRELAAAAAPKAFTPAESVAIWKVGTAVEDVLKLLDRFTPADAAVLCRAVVPAEKALEMSEVDLLTAEQIAAVWAEGVHRSLGDGWL